MNLEEMIMKYGLVSRKRFTKRQKLLFMNGLKQDLDSLNIKCKLLSTKVHNEQAYNLYVGDVENASIIIWSYFDTPNKSFSFYRNSIGKTPDALNRYLSIFLPNLFLFVFGIAFYIKVAQMYLLDGIFQLNDFIIWVTYFILLVLMMNFRKGVANGININRNTSGVIALINYISLCKKKGVAFAFVDYECINNFGELMLKDYAKKCKRFIKLDCVGSKSSIHILEKSEGAIKEVEKIGNEADYIICRADLTNGNYVVNNVNSLKDKNIDIVTEIKEVVLKLNENIEDLLSSV